MRFLFCIFYILCSILWTVHIHGVFRELYSPETAPTKVALGSLYNRKSQKIMLEIGYYKGHHCRKCRIKEEGRKYPLIFLESSNQNYDLMADQGKYDFCVAFTMSFCSLESKQTLISSLFQVILP